MRFFIQSHPAEQAWSVLVSENSLPMFNLPIVGPWHINQLELALDDAKNQQMWNAYEIIVNGEVAEWLDESKIDYTVTPVEYRVESDEGGLNALSDDELLLGGMFTIPNKARAAQFKQAWDCDAGGLIKFKFAAPIKIPPT